MRDEIDFTQGDLAAVLAKAQREHTDRLVPDPRAQDAALDWRLRQETGRSLREILGDRCTVLKTDDARRA
jgi:hypothetical protein